VISFTVAGVLVGSDGGPVGHDVPLSVQFQNLGSLKSCLDQARGVFFC